MNSTFEKHQNEKTELSNILDKEIGELMCAIYKISEKLNEEFLRLTEEAEKKNDFLKTK